MNWDSWIALIALLLALAGLKLQWRRGFSKLGIKVGQGIPVHGQNIGYMMLQIDVRNQRHTPTQVRKLWIRLPNGQNAINPHSVAENPMPHILGSFESTTFLWSTYRELAQALREQGFHGPTRIMAFVEDGSGRRFHGSHEIDVDGWTNSEFRGRIP